MNPKSSRKDTRHALRRTPLHLAVVSILAAGAGFSVHAAEGTQLEEIIITAQKRSENLQDVPISVQALGATALEKANIVSLSDIKAAVPGLNMAQYPGQSDMIYPSIRGIVPNQALITLPIPMAIHMDGVYVGILNGLNTAAADLQRIEILKGPQGVMSGRNATGGAINLYSARPDLGEFWFKQQLTFAQRDQFTAKTVVNVPLGETLAAKFAYVTSSRDNDGVRNSAPGGFKFGERDAESWRLDLRWKAAANVKVDYAFDTAHTKSLETPFQCLVPMPIGVPVPGCTKDYTRTLYAPYNQAKSDNKVEGHTLNIEWDATPTLTLRSITGYRKVDTAENSVLQAQSTPSLSATGWMAGTMPLVINGGNTGFDGHYGQTRTYLTSWSQEFQFLGEFDPRLKYTAGLYFSEDKGHQNIGPRLGGYYDLGLFSPLAQYGLSAGIVTATGSSSDPVNNTSKAIFGQLNWQPDMLDRKLEIVPGIRYTRDHRKAISNNFTGAQYLVTPTTTPLVVNYAQTLNPATNVTGMVGDKEYSNVSPSLSFNYHFEPGVMGYAKYSTAYTTGGFDPTNPVPASYAQGFEPEKIKSVELGMKGEFLDRRLRTNLAVFQSKYTNEQKTVATTIPGTSAPVWVVQNAGGSTYRGAELDITASLSQNLRLSFNAAWLHHEYTAYMVQGVDYASETELVVPKLSYSISMDYRFPSFGLPGKLDGSLSVAHKDSSSTPFTPTIMRNMLGAFDRDWFITPAYTVWNGRLALSRIPVGPEGKGDLTVALWAKNLTDRKYLSMVTFTPAAASAGLWGERRTLGVDLIYRY